MSTYQLTSSERLICGLCRDKMGMPPDRAPSRHRRQGSVGGRLRCPCSGWLDRQYLAAGRRQHAGVSPVRLHGKVFPVVEGNASTVAPMAFAPSNERMIAGVAAASVSLGVAQLVGIPFGARADARAAIGSVVVDLTPGPIKEWAIQTLGSLDKLFLGVVVLVVIATIAAIAGSLETQRRPLGSAAIAAAGIL